MFRSHGLCIDEEEIDSSLTVKALSSYTDALSWYCQNLDSQALDPTLDWVSKLIEIVAISSDALAEDTRYPGEPRDIPNRDVHLSRQLLSTAIDRLSSFYTRVRQGLVINVLDGS